MLKALHYILWLSILVKPVIGLAQFETIHAQTHKDSSYAYVEMVGFGSTEKRAPFWIHTNQFGVVPRQSPAASLRGGFQKYWNLSNAEGKTSHWKVGIGLEGVANTGDSLNLMLPQINASIRYKNLELSVGRKKQWVGLADSTLGGGSYPWSGNAMPIPKIQLATTRFIAVPLTKGWLSFQGFYSDGIFENNRPVTSEMKFHHKAFYLRIGKDHSRLRLHGGFNHQVQWGGKSPYLTNDTNRLPHGWKNYVNAVIGKIGGTPEDTVHFDRTSRIGNHLGSLDLALEIESYASSIFIYRQFIYEDGSLFYLKGITDGLNGIRIRRKNSYGAFFQISEGVLEFLYTKDQGGSDFIIGDNQKRGRDNYFNNQQVRDGWSYYGRTIGTPFIPPSADTRWKYAPYADNLTSNNRVTVLHLGLRGVLGQKVEWYTKFSYSDNSGTYDAPFLASAKQFSGLVALQSRLNWLGGSIIKGSIALDHGDLYPNNLGFSLGLRKELSF